MEREKIHILIVDDVRSMRTHIKQILRTMRYLNISTAEHGINALEALDSHCMAENPVRLILADWHMVPMDGLELLKLVKVHPIHYQTLFIMLTAEDTKQQVIEAITQGVDDYLIKPLTPAKVESRVEGLLRKRNLIT